MNFVLIRITLTKLLLLRATKIPNQYIGQKSIMIRFAVATTP